MAKSKYDYNTFKELFDNEIHYAYEGQYGCDIDDIDYGGVEYAHFYKLCLNADGTGSYKTDRFTFDPRLWPKVKALVELLQETDAEKILFKAKKNGPTDHEESVGD